MRRPASPAFSARWAGPRLLILPLLLAAALAETPLRAQSAHGSDADSAATRLLRAARRAGEVRMDGRLDEGAWAAAEPSSQFTESFPSPGAEPSERTEVRVLYDDGALYIAVRAFDARPDSIAAPLARRDATAIYSDWAHVMIDSYRDRRSAFRFSVNPRGVQKDVYMYDDRSEDLSWDAVWDAGTSVDSAGWTAEFRIPFSQLRYAGAAEGERIWGFQVQRDIARREARVTWAPWTPQSPGFVSLFGELAGLEGVRPVRRIELQPYASTRLTRAPAHEENPFYEENATAGSAGADFKIGLTSGLTLTGTINPDFGQVEVDPAVVNLSVFETFFPEKRPFFVEGAEVFRFGQTRSFNNYQFEEYFYSRRVGRAPQRPPAVAGLRHLDAPQQTTILGAAKVSGKAGRWTIGMMDALTAREEASYATATGEKGSAAVEPRTNYLVARARRELRAGNTVVGAMVTGAHRDLENPLFQATMAGRALFGGVDFEHSWGRRAWTLSGYLSGSHVHGDDAAITALQQTSARYYQRPDADAEHVRLDSERTSLSGYMAELALSHAGPWDGSLVYKTASPGFEINDLGFQGRVDYRALTTFLGRRVNKPGKLFRSYSYYGYSYHAWNFGGDQILNGFALGANGTLNKLWFFGGSAGIQPGTFNDRLTRGGPLSRNPRSWTANVNMGSDARKPLSLSAFASFHGSEAGDHGRFLGTQLDWRPNTTVRLRLNPELGRSHSTAQYVRRVSDASATPTYGQRYVFGAIEQQSLALNTRLDWTFTPRLSLQLYAQPFTAAGDYSDFKELARPGTFEFDSYGRDRGTITRNALPAGRGSYTADPDGAGPAAPFQFIDPDFNLRSLRGNAVLRWEYRPGSVLFFVWQQQRSALEPFGDFELGRDTRGIFDAPATNVFLVKATYWGGCKAKAKAKAKGKGGWRLG